MCICYLLLTSYGLINSRPNVQAFSDDSSYYLLSSLEILTENGELERKADMFTKRTMEKEIDQETKAFMLVKLKALSLMNLIAPEDSTILIERYLEAKTFREIGKTLYVTERQAQRRLKKAVTEYQQVLNESESH